eukprot:g1571.t1
MNNLPAPEQTLKRNASSLSTITTTSNMNTLNSIPDDVKREVLLPLLDGPSYGMLRQVSHKFSVPDRKNFERIMDWVMNKFADLICDIRMIAEDAMTYAEVVEKTKTLAQDTIDPGMDDNVHSDAYGQLFGRLLGRAADTIAYSSGCILEGAGSEDYFRVWNLVEKEAY